jgi:NNP family nitrate/nitrite transporter-like MFS transporter
VRPLAPTTAVTHDPPATAGRRHQITDWHPEDPEFLALFVFSGIGNGSTYKMTPAIFRARATAQVGNGLDPEVARRRAYRSTGALIGIVGAVGASGGVLVNIAFRQSFLTAGTADAAYLAFIACYALCFVVTWAVYLRPGSHRLPGV